MAFDSTHRPLLAALTGAAAAGLLATTLAAPAVQAGPDRSPRSTLAELTVVAGDAGPALVTAPDGRPLARPGGVPSGASDAAVARAHLEQVAPLLGADASSLRAASTTELDAVGPVVRFTQQVGGVPVYGAGLVVSLDESGDLLSVGGSTTDADADRFTVTSGRAADVARDAAAARLDLAETSLRVGTPRKYVYDPALLGDTGSARPAWRVVVAGPATSADKVEVFVDAADGSVLNAFGATKALSIGVCDGANSYTGDASYGWCGQLEGGVRPRDTNHDGVVNFADAVDTIDVPFARIDTATPSGNTDVDQAYDAMQDTADLYQNALGTEGFDLATAIGLKDEDAGNPRFATPNTRRLAGVVRYCDPPEYFYPYFDWAEADELADDMCPYDNAYWTDSGIDWQIGDGPYPGGQMFIGSGLAQSVDVIGHELTHGVTSATNGLIYYRESGAINESMSDVFGQLTQVYANPGTDTAWLVGDDLTGGAIRSMSNPATTSLGPFGRQPDSMTSARWDTDPSGLDNGGVHTNSGVGNKAAYLIANGGTFNGVQVNRLELAHPAHSAQAYEKAAKLYWATQTLLPWNANYRVLGITLGLACNSLVGSNNFVDVDCSSSVAKAVSATRMNVSRVALTTSTKSVKPGRSAVLTARVGDARNTAMANASVRLQKRAAGSSSWITAGTGSTTSSGKKSWTVKPSRSTYYRVVHLGGNGLQGTTSSSLRVALKPTISKSVSKRSIAYRKTFTVRGKVAPTLAGRTVWLQRFSSGTWRTVKKDRLSGSSYYRLKYKPKSRADRNFRVYLPASTTYGSGVSAKFRITVR